MWQESLTSRQDKHELSKRHTTYRLENVLELFVYTWATKNYPNVSQETDNHPHKNISIVKQVLWIAKLKAL
jgi:hypothetical protein